MTKAKNKKLAGRVFSNLTVMSLEYDAKPRSWRCECICGSEVVVKQKALLDRLKQSCGCIKRKRPKRRGAPIHPSMHGLYCVWGGIKDRCYNPNNVSYKNYGGRGVVMCKEWKKNPRAFIKWALKNGWSPDLQIDKDIKSKGTPVYSPDTCSIVTAKENSRHKRNTHWLTFDGETRCLSEWAEIVGIEYSALRSRLKIGWDVERALTKPVNKKKT